MATLTLIACLLATPPAPALHVPCEVVEVYDGDTLTVRISLDVRVRLLDCWAPELKGEQREHGERSRNALRGMLPVGSRGVLSVPFGEADRLDDVLTFGRVLGRIWTDDGDVSRRLRDAGAAFETKEQLTEWLRGKTANP